MGTLSVGLAGVEDSLKGFNKELTGTADTAFEKLSDNARATIGVLIEMQGEIEGFRDAVQDRLFAGLDVVARDLATTFLPLLAEHFGNIADVINLGAKDLAAFVQNAQTLTEIEKVTGNVESAFQILRLAIIPAATALRDIISVGSEFLPVLAGEVVTLAREFANWIAQLRASGELRSFIQGGIENFLQLIEIVKNLGRIIIAVLGAAEDSGNGFLDTLESLSERAANFLESFRAQEGIGNFLDSAREAGKALLPVLLSLGDLFFNSIVPILEVIAKAVGPAVAEFFDALGDALDQAAPGIEAFARGFAEFIRGIIPALPALAQLLSSIGQFVGVLSGRLGPIIASIAIAIANVLTPVFDILSAILLFVNDGFLRFIVVVGTVIAIVAGLATAVRATLTVVSLFAGAFQVLSTALLGTQKAATGAASFLGGPLGIALGIVSIGLGLFLSSSDDAAAGQVELKNAAADLNDVIREQNGVINENVRAKAAQQLREQGILDLANKSGVALSSVTDAYLNQGDALDTLLEQLDAIIAANTIVTTDAEGVTNTVYNDQAQAAVDLRDKILQLIGAREADTNAQAQQQSAAGKTVGLFDVMTTAAVGLASAFTQANDALLKFQQTQLEQLNNDIAYFNQLERTRQELAEGAKTLDINTQAGRDNLSELTKLASAGLARIQDLKNQKASTAEVAQATVDLQNQLLDLVQPFFQNRDAARAFLEQVGLFPPSVTITFYTNLPAILQQIQRITTAIGNITGGLFGFGRNARGGPVRAGEWSLVGEEGPELVRFGRSARVYSTDESERMATRVGTLDAMTTRGAAQRAGAMVTSPTGGGIDTTVTNNVELRPTIRVYLGDRELTDVVRVEVDRRDRQLQRLVTSNAGVRR